MNKDIYKDAENIWKEASTLYTPAASNKWVYLTLLQNVAYCTNHNASIIETGIPAVKRALNNL